MKDSKIQKYWGSAVIFEKYWHFAELLNFYKDSIWSKFIIKYKESANESKVTKTINNFVKNNNKKVSIKLI